MLNFSVVIGGIGRGGRVGRRFRPFIEPLNRRHDSAAIEIRPKTPVLHGRTGVFLMRFGSSIPKDPDKKQRESRDDE